MLQLLVLQVIPQTFLFLLQFTDFEIRLLVQSNKLHIQITDFVLLLLTVFLEFSDFELILLVVAEVVPFDVLDLEMVLVLQLTYLYVLHVFNLSDFLLEPLNLVDEFPVFEVVGGGTVYCEGFVFVLPHLHFVLLLVD